MKKFVMALCLLGLPSGGNGQNTVAAGKQVDRLFSRFNSHTPGVSVTVLSGGKIVFSKGYGSANLEYGIPVRPATVFDIASLSKQVTAFAIATLIVRGEISMEDDVRKYIPELHDFGETVTIGHLLGHTSGLRDQNDLLNLLGYRDGDIIANEQVLALIFRQKALNFSPGKQFSYSNSGYTLLAQVVARVTKTPFPEWAQQHIFTPLGMKHTFFITDHAALIPGKAYSYGKSEHGFRKVPINSTNSGARGLQSTTEDFALWAANFWKHSEDSVIKLMNTPPVNDLRLKYAFGQAFSDYKGQRLVEHDGSDAGYRTYFARFPDKRLAVILFGNLETINARNTGLQIADIFLGATSPEPPAEEKIILPEYTEAMLEGQFRVSPETLLTIWADDHVIRATVNDQEKEYVLQRLSTILLESNELGASLSPKKGRVGEPDSIVYRTKAGVVTVPKIFVENPGREKLKEFEGEYFSEELFVTYRIYLQNNQLAAELPRGVLVRLRQRGPDTFSGSYYWFKKLKFVRDAANKIAGFEVSAGRSLDIRFSKTK